MVGGARLAWMAWMWFPLSPSSQDCTVTLPQDPPVDPLLWFPHGRVSMSYPPVVFSSCPGKEKDLVNERMIESRSSCHLGCPILISICFPLPRHSFTHLHSTPSLYLTTSLSHGLLRPQSLVFSSFWIFSCFIYSSINLTLLSNLLYRLQFYNIHTYK